MDIQHLFSRDINRSINGVVKVTQDDEASLEQELSEYVITRELQRHFADFFEAYASAIDAPTDKVGVWISGFFGSGKSHFLKMLSYLLANKSVAGRAAIDYFADKVADPMVQSQMHRAVSIPTETILFNIDSKGGQWKEGAEAKTALLRAFARVFYEHRGFYGADLKLARLERFIESQGKTAEFRAAFERENGGSWLENRASYDFFEDDVIAALVQACGMSREAAQHWFDGTETDAVAPDQLADEIRAYAEERARQHGGQFRLLFMVDEVGQFIGSDVNLMLNLQTLVEELGAKCQGRVWVMVTSQEAIDEVTKVAGNDFSKIQGRFNTRLSLSSSSVDEVIKRRVLEKTPAAKALLEGEYAEQSAVLKNLFCFEGCQSDLGGYAGAGDFVESYPFVGYQFKLMPDVLAEIRKHGNAGKHLSGGERSMLSGFQEAAQKMQGEEASALVPFWRFYDTISTFLEHGIRQVIERCQRAAENMHGIQPQDVSVLKTLYLIRYISGVKATVGNIAILLVDSMDVDKVSLREQVKMSLDRLVRENYVARSGDTYNFLTDEEQDVTREIKNTPIDAALISDRIKRILFDGIYNGKTKYRKGANDFPFDRFVDDALYGASSGGMKLNIITVAHELSDADDAQVALRSTSQALVVLPPQADYYETLENVVRTEKYVNTRNVAQLPESTQEIIRAKQKQARADEGEVRGMLEVALKGARCAVGGRMVTIRAASARQVLDAALDELVASTFTKASYIGAPIEGEADLLQVLMGTSQRTLEGTGGGNARAVEELERHLDMLQRTHQAESIGDVQRMCQAKPYGWREIDVACVLAQLICDQKAVVKVAGEALDAHSVEGRRRIVGCLRGKGAEGATIQKRELPAAGLMRSARDLLKDVTYTPLATDDVDTLVAAVRKALEDQQERCRSLLRNEYDASKPWKYPGEAVVEQGAHLASVILGCAADDTALLKEFVAKEVDLIDWREEMNDVEEFFPNRQRLFDEACETRRIMREEKVYVEGNADVQSALAELGTIIDMEKPGSRVSELAGLSSRVRAAYDVVVRDKRGDLLERIDAVGAEVSDYAQSMPEAAAHAVSTVLFDMETDLANYRTQAHQAKTCSKLDTLAARLVAWRDSQVSKIDGAVERCEREAQERAQAQARAQVAQVSQPAYDYAVGSVDATDGGMGAESAQAIAGGGASFGDTGSTAHPSSGASSDARSARPARSRVRRVSRDELCPLKRLGSEEDVEAYVDKIRVKLLAALNDADAVRVG